MLVSENKRQSANWTNREQLAEAFHLALAQGFVTVAQER